MKLQSLLFSGAMFFAGCASTATGMGPITGGQDLAGTRWKLPMVQGARDGRTIEFRPAGTQGYRAVLTKVGMQLQKVVGAYEGAVMMELIADRSPGTFRGVEQIPGQDLREVTCSLSASGEEMKCSNEDWIWMRDS
jgi:hypothetical protein